MGQDFSITHERIRRIEAKALRNLQHPSRSQNFGPRQKRAMHHPAGYNLRVAQTAQDADAIGPAEPAEVFDHDGRVIDIAPIRQVLARINARLHPVQVWLFGSRARGEARSWSDWDLFVVLPDDADDALFDPLLAWELRKDPVARVDLVLCRDTDFRDARGTHNTLAFETASEGVRIA